MINFFRLSLILSVLVVSVCQNIYGAQQATQRRRIETRLPKQAPQAKQFLIKLADEWVIVENDRCGFNITTFEKNNLKTLKEVVRLQEFSKGLFFDVPKRSLRVEAIHTINYKSKIREGMNFLIAKFKPKPGHVYIIYNSQENVPANLKEVRMDDLLHLLFKRPITEEPIRDYRNKIVSKVVETISKAGPNWDITPPGLIPIISEYAIDDAGNL